MKNYTVFDFDETCINSDVSNVFVYYILKEMLLKTNVSEFEEALILRTANDEKMASYLATAYARALKGGRGSQEHKLFVDIFCQFYQNAFSLYGLDASHILMANYEVNELNNLVCIAFEQPDSYYVDTILPSLYKATSVFEYSRFLIEKMRLNDIKPYIISASPDILVKAIACNPKYGFNFSEQEVFGTKLEENYDQTVSYFLDEEAIYPRKEGKTSIILEKIAPLYQNKEPLLVAGDGNGDLDMLQHFTTKSLLYDRKHGKEFTQFLDKVKSEAELLNLDEYNDLYTSKKYVVAHPLQGLMKDGVKSGYSSENDKKAVANFVNYIMKIIYIQ